MKNQQCLDLVDDVILDVRLFYNQRGFVIRCNWLLLLSATLLSLQSPRFRDKKCKESTGTLGGVS